MHASVGMVGHKLLTGVWVPERATLYSFLGETPTKADRKSGRLRTITCESITKTGRFQIRIGFNDALEPFLKSLFTLIGIRVELFDQILVA